MNENAKQWVAALRSGEFKQGAGRLRKAENYCCLGVACELYRRQDPAGHQWTEVLKEVFNFMDKADSLPEPVRLWLGLTQPSGAYTADISISLAGKNDEGVTFTELADLIESEPQGLFVTTS